ncbi:MAG TPA: hypothetical protein ENJ92_01545 [Chloroflexi bacterium]|nr:hypothetical protein [Chloroflexota bacterium]
MMKQIMVVVKKDLRETLRTRAFYFSIALVLFLMIMLGGIVRGQINSTIEQGLTPAEVIPVIQPIMGTIVFTLSLLVMMLFCLYVSAYTLTMEKIKHSLESLLCTPLSLRQIWLGKSLTVFLPGAILGLLFAFAAMAGINQFFIAPQIGQSVTPGAAPLVATLVAAPLIIFFLVTLLVALQLIIANIRWINIAFMGLIYGVGFGISPFVKLGSASWNIVFISLAVAAILALVTMYLSRLVTKERIVLSSKG